VLSIVGIGPGNLDLLTQRAYRALKTSEVIAGYKRYVRLLADLTSGKEVISTGMTQEVDRVRAAIDKAREGRRVCLISSGDPGIYGMAGLVLEILGKEEKEGIRIEIIPGVTALSGCASRLGAPLMHDFAVISLSDLLTDLKLIELRVLYAARADFVIAFYNPQSKKRTAPIRRAWQILLRHKPPRTPVGIVRNCERGAEEVIITTLEKMPSYKKIDMVTMIIVGSSRTYVKDGQMITPRGYRL
jgi:precorrin-3B C17-methyltransferase